MGFCFVPPSVSSVVNLVLLLLKSVKPITKFIKSAAKPEQFPPARAPEVAFLGRSNVGKSSLLNSLVGTKMAHVSSTPGRTQTINFFDIRFSPRDHEPQLIFADLPGYGYAKVPRAIASDWPSFIEPYLREREPLALAISLVDINIPPQQSDRQLHEFLRSTGRPFLVVGTKADKLTANNLNKQRRLLEKDLGLEILPYSAKSGSGRNELWKILRELGQDQADPFIESDEDVYG